MMNEAGGPQPRTFTVRMWAEHVGDGVEHRGRVQDVTTGAFRSFRRWSELNQFLAERLAKPGRNQERR